MLAPERKQALAELAQKCGVKLSNFALLDLALTHPTYAFEHRKKGIRDNQRLEFLGDAVLNLVVAEEIYQSYPERPEGDLTKIRAAVVCAETLARKAKKLGLGRYLLLGRGEELAGGREKPSLLADAFEAVGGAFYLGEGLEVARQFILRELRPEIKKAALTLPEDYKSRLQEEVQAKYAETVSYVTLRERGPDHAKQFLVGAVFRGKLLAMGKGRSKKEAAQKAAQKVLARGVIEK